MPSRARRANGAVTIDRAVSRTYSSASDAQAVITEVPAVQYEWSRTVTAGTVDPDPTAQEPTDTYDLAEGASQVVLVATADCSVEVWADDPVAGWVRCLTLNLTAYQESDPVPTRYRRTFVRVTSAAVDVTIRAGVLV